MWRETVTGVLCHIEIRRPEEAVAERLLEGAVGARFALRAREARQTLRRAHGTSRRFVGVTLSSAPHLRRLVLRRPIDRAARHARGDDSASRPPGGHVPDPREEEPTLAILAYAGVSPASATAPARRTKKARLPAMSSSERRITAMS